MKIWFFTIHMLDADSNFMKLFHFLSALLVNGFPSDYTKRQCQPITLYIYLHEDTFVSNKL